MFRTLNGQLGNLKTFRHRFAHRLGIALGIASAHLHVACYEGDLASSTATRHLADLATNSCQVLIWVSRSVRDLRAWIVFLLGFPLNLRDQVAKAIFTLWLLIHTRAWHGFWDPIASRSFLHIWKADVRRIHILDNASFDGCSMGLTTSNDCSESVWARKTTRPTAWFRLS